MIRTAFLLLQLAVLAAALVVIALLLRSEVRRPQPALVRTRRVR